MATIALPGLSGQAFAQADLDCNKCVDASDIAKNAVNTSKLDKNAVTSNKIAKNAVTSSKIAINAVSAPKLGEGVPSKIKQGGYDLANVLVDSAIPANHFDAPSMGGLGDTSLTLRGGEDVLVMGSVQVYRDPNDAVSGDVITGSLIPCVWNTDMDIFAEGAVLVPGYDVFDFSSVTPICKTSTGEDDQASVATSYLFTDMPAGKYEFGLCPSKWNDGGCATEEGANFVVQGTKVAVIKTN